MLDSSSFDVINPFWSFSGVEVGEHWYWSIGSLKVHGQVFVVSWIVIAALLGLAVFGTRKVQRSPQGWQNFMEFVLEFLYFVKKRVFSNKSFPFFGPRIEKYRLDSIV